MTDTGCRIVDGEYAMLSSLCAMPEQGEKIMRTIKVKGMSCEHCVKAVVKALSEIEGVANVKVDLSKGEASFEESKPIDENVLRERIQKAGYELG